MGFFDNIRRFGEDIARWSEKAIKGLKEFSSAVGEVILEIYEGLRINEKFDYILVNNNWPPIRKIDFEMKKAFVYSFEKNEINSFEYCIEKYILNNIAEEYLNCIFEDWKNNSLLSDRFKLLEEVIKAHKSGYYFSSVILILSQIEGVIAKGFYHNDTMRLKNYKRYIEQMYSDNPTVKEEAFRKFILETVLVQFKHGHPISSDISRHAIMHGADKEYGTYLNSIKMLLIFDYLQESFNYLYIEGSKTLHVYGCNYLSRTNKKVRSAKNIWTLPSMDFKKCKVCMQNSNNIS